MKHCVQNKKYNKRNTQLNLIKFEQSNLKIIIKKFFKMPNNFKICVVDLTVVFVVQVI